MTPWRTDGYNSVSNRRLYGELLNVVYKKPTSLVREQARLHSELDIAARIQTGLLRRDFGGLEEQLGLRAWALMEPAKEVGGDFYDIFPAAPGKACIVIADANRSATAARKSSCPNPFKSFTTRL